MALISTDGPLGLVWISGTWDKKVSKAQVLSVDLFEASRDIEASVSDDSINLRLCAKLLVGVARLLARKAGYLASDAAEAMVHMRAAFRPGAELPHEGQKARTKAITVANFDDLDPSLDLDLPLSGYSSGGQWADQNWAEAAATKAVAQPDDIVLQSSVHYQSRESSESSIELMRGHNEARQSFASADDPMADLDPVRPDELPGARRRDSSFEMKPIDDLDDIWTGMAPPNQEEEENDSIPPQDQSPATPKQPAADAADSLHSASEDSYVPLAPITTQNDDISSSVNKNEDPALSETEEEVVLTQHAEKEGPKPRKKPRLAKPKVDTKTQLDARTIQQWLRDATNSSATAHQDQEEQRPTKRYRMPAFPQIEALSKRFKLNERGLQAKQSSIAAEEEEEEEEEEEAVPDPLAPAPWHTPASDSAVSTPEIGRFKTSSPAEQDVDHDELPPAPLSYDNNEQSPARTPLAPIAEDLDDFMSPLAAASPAATPPSSNANRLPQNQEDEDNSDHFSTSSPIEREWHPNTVKVAHLLRDALTDTSQSLPLSTLTAQADKSATVGIFVELLHLKSWDFIQLAQTKPRAEITISPASCFDDPIPAE